MLRLRSVFFNSSNVILNRNRVDNDGHKAVIYTTQFATLSVVDSGSVNVKTNLVKTTGNSIHFKAERRDRSAMQNVDGSNKHTNICSNRQY